MPEIEKVIGSQSVKDVVMSKGEMVDGVKVYSREEIQVEAPKRIEVWSKERQKKQEKYKVDKFVMEYSVKGSNPDFIMRVLR